MDSKAFGRRVLAIWFVVILGACGGAAQDAGGPSAASYAASLAHPEGQQRTSAPQINPYAAAEPPSLDLAAAPARVAPAEPIAVGPAPQPTASALETPAPQSAAVAPPPAQRLSRDLVQRQIDEVQKAQDLEGAVKADVIKRYKTALDWLMSAEEAANKAAQYEVEIQQAPEQVKNLKAQLAAPVPKLDPSFPPQATLQEMEQLLAQAETRLKDARDLVTRREEELKRRTERKGELAKVADETERRLEDARKQLSGPPPSNAESPSQAAARRLELDARLAAMESQLRLYEVEARRHDALAELLPLQRDLARRDRSQLDKAVAAQRQAVASRRKAESERQAREARRELASTHPRLRALASRNAELAEQRMTVASAITEISAEVGDLEKQLAKLKRRFEDTQEKTRQAGHSSTIGLMLRTRGRELPNLRQCEQRIRYVSRVMPEENLNRMTLEDERATLGDLQTVVAHAMNDVRGAGSEHQDDWLAAATRELLEKRRELLDQLVADQDTYLTKLSELEVNNRKLAAQTRQFADYIDEHVLWIRSAEMLSPRDAVLSVQGLSSLAQPEQWFALAAGCGLDALRRPAFAAAAVAALALLIVFHARMQSRVRWLCHQAPGSASLRFWPTLEATFWSGAMAAEWPLAAAYLGWHMSTSDRSPELGYALGCGLRCAALLCWVGEFTRRVCCAGGLAESHFGWSPYSLRVVRRHLRWLMCAGAPLAAAVVVAHKYREGEWSNSLGRFAFITAMLLLAAFMHAILRSKDNLLREIIAAHPEGWLARLRFVCYCAAVGLPLALAAMAGVGYYYSAQELAIRLQGTLALVLGLTLSHALVSRWFLVQRRNLAIEQARQRQGEQPPGDGSLGPGAADGKTDKHDLSKLHEQLQYLLRHAVAAGLVVVGWMIWADVLPALKVLDNRVLWWNTVEVAEMQQDANGNLVRQKVEQDVPTTLRHALFAGALLVATLFFGRNLPALLAITVLQRLPLDKGARHAIAVVLRYAVALAGVVLACRTLSVRWSSVQWLAAGMTVGLGFGLQEIFANFVSGLILLFERPIRVGDIITLDDVTGAVTNIHIRATTVRNWDGKELIVPNKELITGRMLNWTLSDSVNRIVITVGVAYKSDTRRVRAVMMAAAREHPEVMDDPAPNATLEGFGDSALQFVLRCYVANLDVRLATIHELHETIHDRLNEAGIEIAFPQRELHIRSAEGLAALSPTDRRERRAEAA